MRSALARDHTPRSQDKRKRQPIKGKKRWNGLTHFLNVFPFFPFFSRPFPGVLGHRLSACPRQSASSGLRRRRCLAAYPQPRRRWRPTPPRRWRPTPPRHRLPGVRDPAPAARSASERFRRRRRRQLSPKLHSIKYWRCSSLGCPPRAAPRAGQDHSLMECSWQQALLQRRPPPGRRCRRPLQPCRTPHTFVGETVAAAALCPRAGPRATGSAGLAGSTWRRARDAYRPSHIISSTTTCASSDVCRNRQMHIVPRN